jgi:hypothetical protein
VNQETAANTEQDYAEHPGPTGSEADSDHEDAEADNASDPGGKAVKTIGKIEHVGHPYQPEDTPRQYHSVPETPQKGKAAAGQDSEAVTHDQDRRSDFDHEFYESPEAEYVIEHPQRKDQRATEKQPGELMFEPGEDLAVDRAEHHYAQPEATIQGQATQTGHRYTVDLVGYREIYGLKKA